MRWHLLSVTLRLTYVRPDCFQASLFPPTPFSFAHVQTKLFPRDYAGVGGGTKRGGMSIFLLLAWAIASSHRRSSGELESRPLVEREVEATRGCEEEPGSRQGREEAMGQELKGAL